MATAPPSNSLACPNCQAPIDLNDAACQNCGAGIDLMTLAADREVLGRALTRSVPPSLVHPEQLVPRLGDYLVQHGYLTQAQLEAALARQAQAETAQTRRLIGETLVEMGFVSAETLDYAIARRLLELQAALIDAKRELEQRVAERTHELKVALARLSEFNQLKANFVSNVSHELRTPLTHIKGYNALLREGTLGPLTPEQENALGVTGRAIERLEQLIDDLISYSAASKGELALNQKPVAIEALIRHAVARSQPKAERQRVSLTHELPARLAPVLADEEKLIWTLLQLIDNGIKFTPGGGRVSVRASDCDDTVLIAVCDTGIGIPAGRIEHIFEPFRQLDGSSTRRYGGTGLGLALVQRILEAHGTRLEVESQEQKGSRFSFALPRFSEQVPP